MTTHRGESKQKICRTKLHPNINCMIHKVKKKYTIKVVLEHTLSLVSVPKETTLI